MAAGGMAVVAVGSAVADWRRQRRRNLDAAGFMPWALIQVMSMLGAVIFAALAVKG